MAHRKPGLAWALQQSFKSGYNFKKFLQDCKAGITVGIVAMPLSMALSVASGVSPQNGLYTAAIAGIICALLGGSKYQVTGPTAALVVLLVPVVEKFGLSGLLLAGFMSGFILIALGLLRVAEVIQYVPHPVTTGFTSGTAVVIAIIQLKDFFGLEFSGTPLYFVDRMIELYHAFPGFSGIETAIGVGTLLLILIAVRWVRVIPWPAFALIVISSVVYFAKFIFTDLKVKTIGTRFMHFENGSVEMGFPQGLPSFHWPWEISTPHFAAYELTWNHIVQIAPYAFSIALLGAIVTLMSAVIVDGVKNEKHNPNAEVIGLGIGNIITPLFGGIPATGAIARTMTGIRFGAQSPIAAVIHGLVIVLALLLIAPLINMIPMSALAAILLYVAYNMSERKHFAQILTSANRDDRIVLLTCFSLTVFMDMTVGVGVGVGLASLLFIRRVSQLTGGKIFAQEDILREAKVKVPHDVFVYKIRGALFFGAAQKAIEALQLVSAASVRVVILDLSDVDLIDSTGAVALNSVLKSFVSVGRRVELVGASLSVMEAIRHMDIFKTHKELITEFQNLTEAITATEMKS